MNDNDKWVLERLPGESDDEYREAAEFWRRELAQLVDGVSISDHLEAGRAVLIDARGPEHVGVVATREMAESGEPSSPEFNETAQAAARAAGDAEIDDMLG